MKAIARYVRIAPRKARLVADQVRGKSVPAVIAELEYTNKRAAGIVSDVVRSAAANAEHNDGRDPDELFVTEIRVDEGPTIKRFRPRAMGRATMIRKRTSHVSVKLGNSPKVLVGTGRATGTPGDEEEN